MYMIIDNSVLCVDQRVLHEQLVLVSVVRYRPTCKLLFTYSLFGGESWNTKMCGILWT